MSIDYKKLFNLMGLVIEKAKTTQSECLEIHPDNIKICDNAVEDLGNLLTQIEACVLRDGYRNV